MEMLVIAVLLGLSLASFLTAKIAKMLDMSHKMFLRLGVLFCVAAGAPFAAVMLLQESNDSNNLALGAGCLLACVVSDLIAAFTSKDEVIPPNVPVKRPGQGRVARSAKEVAHYLLIGFVFYVVVRRSLPFLGRMSGWDMVAFGFFTMAAIIRGFQSLFLKVEICGNGLWDRAGSRPMLKPWEAFESFSWTEETKDGFELKLQAKSSGQGTTPLLVRPEDRAVVQQILEANLPDQLSGAHDGLNRRVLPACVRAKRTKLRRFARHMVSVLCWPTVVLLLFGLWNRSASLETFSGVGSVSIMITMAVNSWPSQRIEICKNGLLLDDELLAWDQYECFFWKGETGDGVELRLPSKTTDWVSMTRLVVAPEDREAVQKLLEASLQDRSTDSEAYSKWSLF
jgi:hypothetical protein